VQKQYQISHIKHTDEVAELVQGCIISSYENQCIEITRESQKWSVWWNKDVENYKKTVRHLSNRVKSYGEWPYIKPSTYTKKRFRRLIYFHGRGTIKSLKEPLAVQDPTEFWPTE